MSFKNIRKALFTLAAAFIFIGGVSAETIEERMEALFEESQPYIDFFKKLKAAVAADDQKVVARMVEFPLEVTLPEGKKTIENKKEFIEHYDVLFTPEVIEIIAKQKKDKLFVNSNGVMIGQGEVWFSGLGKDKYDDGVIVKIIAINPDASEAAQ